MPSGNADHGAWRKILFIQSSNKDKTETFLVPLQPKKMQQP
jgi:hypothetical protein